MNINNVGFTYVNFGNGLNGKRRPILITYVDSNVVHFLSITSQYEKKSDEIKKQYYPIREWREIGLPKESWIDIGSIREMNLGDLSLDYIGTLTTIDVAGLAEFIENFNKDTEIGRAHV